MNVFSPGSRHQPWVWQVTGLCFVLGALISGSLQTVTNIRRAGIAGRIGSIAAAPINPQLADTVRKQEKEIADLRDHNTQLENTLAKGTGEAKALNDELQKTKVLAGVTAVRGPGVVLSLQDSKHGPPADREFDRPNYIIHDFTIQQVINELNAAQAEAISINGQRVISRTPIRCVGPTALVNNVAIASPFEIRAIGDPATLAGGLNIPGGVLDGIRSWDPEMAHLEKRAEITVPAYAGSTAFRFGKPVAAKSAAGDSSDEDKSSP